LDGSRSTSRRPRHRHRHRRRHRRRRTTTLLTSLPTSHPSSLTTVMMRAIDSSVQTSTHLRHISARTIDLVNEFPQSHPHTTHPRYNTRTHHDVFISEYPASSKKFRRSICNLTHTDTAIISSSCHNEPAFGRWEACSHAAERYAPHTTCPINVHLGVTGHPACPDAIT
jgi:hypothetical protein